MFIRIGYELEFEIPAPVSMLLMLFVHPSRAADLRREQRVVTVPEAPIEHFIDPFGNHAGRILAPASALRLSYDNIIQDSGYPEPGIEGLRLHPVEELPVECLPFLLASRYCEVDRMSAMAWDLFGKTPATWERVKAVLDWVHGHVQFGYAFASPTKSAFDVCNDKQGVAGISCTWPLRCCAP